VFFYILIFFLTKIVFLKKHYNNYIISTDSIVIFHQSIELFNYIMESVTAMSNLVCDFLAQDFTKPESVIDAIEDNLKMTESLFKKWKDGDIQHDLSNFQMICTAVSYFDKMTGIASKRNINIPHDFYQRNFQFGLKLIEISKTVL
jgi:hypothetical protein